MKPKIDIVTQDDLRIQKSKLIIGFQVGIFGYVIRIGLYKEF